MAWKVGGWFNLLDARQGEKKLREHRFLPCLEGKYSDSAKL